MSNKKRIEIQKKYHWMHFTLILLILFVQGSTFDGEFETDSFKRVEMKDDKEHKWQIYIDPEEFPLVVKQVYCHPEYRQPKKHDLENLTKKYCQGMIKGIQPGWTVVAWDKMIITNDNVKEYQPKLGKGNHGFITFYKSEPESNALFDIKVNASVKVIKSFGDKTRRVKENDILQVETKEMSGIIGVNKNYSWEISLDLNKEAMHNIELINEDGSTTKIQEAKKRCVDSQITVPNTYEALLQMISKDRNEDIYKEGDKVKAKSTMKDYWLSGKISNVKGTKHFKPDNDKKFSQPPPYLLKDMCIQKIPEDQNITKEPSNPQITENQSTEHQNKVVKLEDQNTKEEASNQPQVTESQATEQKSTDESEEKNIFANPYVTLPIIVVVSTCWFFVLLYLRDQYYYGRFDTPANDDEFSATDDEFSYTDDEWPDV